MLEISPKGTVPVLFLANGQVLEQSRDIMQWALKGNDPMGLLNANSSETDALLDENDTCFKANLDRFKYPDRYRNEPTDHVGVHARFKAEAFLQTLEARLQQHAYLMSESLSLADIGLVPFVRQFSQVDPAWFSNAPYPALQRWLKTCLNLAPFVRCMQKYPAWYEGAPETLLETR
jgi:glutathione S-transferase